MTEPFPQMDYQELERILCSNLLYIPDNRSHGLEQGHPGIREVPRVRYQSPSNKSWILQEGIETPAQLNKFRVAGYRYDKAASTDTKPVFRRAEGAA